MKHVRKQSNFIPLCYYDVHNVTLCVVLPLSIMLLSCTGIEEDSNDDYSDDYEVDTIQEETDGENDDNVGDGDGDDDDDDVGRYKLYIILLMHNNAFHVLLSPFSN